MKQKKCSKCDVSKCHASCCYNVPMERAMFTVYKAHIQTPIIDFRNDGLKDDNGNALVTPVTDYDFHKNKCPFLKKNYKCAIYDRRPKICRIFGTPPIGTTSKFLQCGWLNGEMCDNTSHNEQDIENGLIDILNLTLNHRL